MNLNGNVTENVSVSARGVTGFSLGDRPNFRQIPTSERFGARFILPGGAPLISMRLTMSKKSFVHLQKTRLRPSAALFKLADANLEKYPPLHDRLRIDRVRALIHDWLRKLEAGNFELNPLVPGQEPALYLES
jgi:hypothetical protein